MLECCRRRNALWTSEVSALAAVHGRRLPRAECYQPTWRWLSVWNKQSLRVNISARGLKKTVGFAQWAFMMNHGL